MTTDFLGARPAARPDETPQNLAMLGYSLLFLAIFFAGLPALIAVFIAYSQRDSAPRHLRSHFSFQIRIFWIAFALTIAAAACATAGVVAGLGEIIDVAAVTGFDGFGALRLELSDVTIPAGVIALLATAVVLGFLSSFWLLLASAIGFIKLASEPVIGHSARP
jgi:uncharacterized membrane protein